MNSAKALILILALMGHPAIFLRIRTGVEPSQINQTNPVTTGMSGSNEFQFKYGWWGIDFISGTQKHHIDLSRLPVYANDCFSPSQCSSKRRTFCEVCIKYIAFVAWDANRQRLFFEIATDISQNKPWILAGFDFKSDRPTRYGEFYGGGAGDAVISPSGRYIAMESHAKNGICGTLSFLMVADLTEHRIGTEKLQISPTPQEHPDIVRIEKLRWTGPGEIAYDEFSHKDNDCGNFDVIPRRTKSVKVADIAFK